MISLTGASGVARIAVKLENLPAAEEEQLLVDVTAATELVYRQAHENIFRMFRNPAKMQSALRMAVERTSSGTVVGTVSIEGRGYAALERGSRPHWIFPTFGRVLAFERGDGPIQVSRAGRDRGGVIFSSDVRHPGTRAYHFLRSAIAEHRSEIRAAFKGFATRAWERASR